MNSTTNLNYFGKQHSKSSYVKEFSNSVNQNISYFVYKIINGLKYTTPADSNTDVYIPNNLVVDGNLIVNGTITNPSDITFKKNVVEIDTTLSDNLLKLKPIQFNYKFDKTNKTHYGLNAQELQDIHPTLVTKSKYKGAEILNVNYIEIVPLLISQIQSLQEQIDELKQEMKLTHLAEEPKDPASPLPPLELKLE
jgi:hypothetical protein